MKFGRYLAENQTPEWKRAYIDYRQCKKKIKVVAARLGQVKERKEGGLSGGEEGDDGDSSGADDDHGPSAPPREKRGTPDTIRGSLRSRMGSTAATPRLDRWTSRASDRNQRYGSTGVSPRPPQSSTSDRFPPPLDIGSPSVDNQDTFSSGPSPNPAATPNQIQTPRSDSSARSKRGLVFSPSLKADAIVETTIEEESQHSRQSSGDSDTHLNKTKHPEHGQTDGKKGEGSQSIATKSPRLWSPRLAGNHGITASSSNPDTPKGGKSPRLGPRSMRSMTLPSPAIPFRSSPGGAIKTADNFDELYKQLEPDEKDFFDFLEHELDKVEAFYLARENDAMKRSHDLREQLKELAEHRKIYHELYPHGVPEWETKVGRILPQAQAVVGGQTVNKLRQRLGFQNHDLSPEQNQTQNVNANLNVNSKDQQHLQVNDSVATQQRSSSPMMMDETTRSSLREAMAADKDHQTYNPERYQKYKKELKTAVLEFYRQLELIKNYRIMNLTGFRKALKKFEKTTKIICLEMYTDEKISKATFSQSEAIDGLIKQIEDLYTIHFEHGDSKRARDKLRRQITEKTHYDSVFRSGIMIGIGLPAAVFAIIESSKSSTREEIPAWGGLLQVYGGLYLPIMFAMLFQLNLGAYVAARINYEFVMELTRPTIDYRSFLEIPAFLFLTLSYCFYFTFAQIGSSNVAPTTWPAAWLVLVAVFFLNPLPVLRRGTRYWLLKVLFRVCTPGYSRVEFIAFFLADELNSLVYSVQNIYFISCGYSKKWPGDVFEVCHSAKTWPYALLACLPAGSRFIQCLKRYHDSKLNIHLINAGKYLSVILQQCLFVYWRSRDSVIDDKAFIIWIIVAIISAVYTSTWDLVIDWSLFRPQAGLLRKDLGYSQRYVYYLAMTSNVLVRFVFIWYLPLSTENVRMRSFLFALAEMLRRWQWNFFRVETEHLGNADAYRVTREIPLPYRRINNDSDEDGDGEMEDRKSIYDKEKYKKRNMLSYQLDKLKSRHSIKNKNNTSTQTQGNGGVTSSGTPNGISSPSEGIAEEEEEEGEGRGPDALNAGPRGHEPQREYEASRPGDYGRTPRGTEAV
ncbi:uncharacterized protein I303_107193 [Kwoniella dejecticola CBS 10117]|uniref:Signal transduction-related protein n=1 Tax=Kwoniella dejecticola CBS 10117 TaxID=1296121 RepID=A0A1A5ZZ20_9TREE|nr:uncharacterized protein I303_06594 [Kwoniella dejecticola CBS 10117]OBR83035.1 hypothetical protein I303_06594 [Kwoniella dejecticola CBS 10117]